MNVIIKGETGSLKICENTALFCLYFYFSEIRILNGKSNHVALKMPCSCQCLRRQKRRECTAKLVQVMSITCGELLVNCYRDYNYTNLEPKILMPAECADM